MTLTSMASKSMKSGVSAGQQSDIFLIWKEKCKVLLVHFVKFQKLYNNTCQVCKPYFVILNYHMLYIISNNSYQ